MAIQQERIKTLMRTIYDANPIFGNAVDAGIRSVSNFSGATDLVNSLLNEMRWYQARGRSLNAFLRERCGIDLGNADTGAITGADAGGTLKTADSVVPETTPRACPPSARVEGLIPNLTVEFPTDVVAGLVTKTNAGASPETFTGDERLVSGLYSWWLKSSVDLIEESLGGSFATSGKHWNLRVRLLNESELMYVGDAYVNVTGENSMELCINRERFSGISTNENGTLPSLWHLDRLFPHELTHAVIIANFGMTKSNQLPIWLSEGLADAMSGNDDSFAYQCGLGDESIMITNEAIDYVRYGLTCNTNVNNLAPYHAGYLATRYLMHTGGSPVAGKSTAEAAALWGNASANNVLAGTAGADMFWYAAAAGDGEDVIVNSAPNDVVTLYTPVNIDAITMHGGDLYVDMGAGNGLTVQNWSENSAVNTFQLWDGSRWGLHQNEAGGIDAYRR